MRRRIAGLVAGISLKEKLRVGNFMVRSSLWRASIELLVTDGDENDGNDGNADLRARRRSGWDMEGEFKIHICPSLSY